MKEIRDAVKALKHYKPTNNEIAILIDLAEKVLAVEEKMPEKMTIFRSGDEEILFTHNDIRRRINETIDQCTLAITGALLSEEEMYQVIKDETERHFRQQNNDWDKEFAKVSSKAIHSAQMEKLGGE